MLGLPSSVKYINRANRPKRVFIKRDDGTLEDIFSIHLVYSGREASPTQEHAMRWNQDPDRNGNGSQTET